MSELQRYTEIQPNKLNTCIVPHDNGQYVKYDDVQKLLKKITDLKWELNDMANHAKEYRTHRDQLQARIAEYGMGAGHAHQKRAEANAVRDELGFSKDDENVSPRDLRNAIKSMKREVAKDTFERAANIFTDTLEKVAILSFDDLYNISKLADQFIDEHYPHEDKKSN